MTTAALDPAEAIRAAVDELLGELRQLDGAGDVDGLLDRITAALKSARGKVGRARKRAAAVETKTQPAKTEPARPVPTPRPAVQPARVTPKPATRPTATVPITPRKTPAAEPAKTAPERNPSDGQLQPAGLRRGTRRLEPPQPRNPGQAERPRRHASQEAGRRRRAHGTRVPLTEPGPRWLLPLLLVAAVLLVALPLVAGWTGAISGAVIGAAALLARSRWPHLIPLRKGVTRP